MTEHVKFAERTAERTAAPRRTNGAMTFLRLAALMLLVLFTYAMGTIPANERNAIGSTFAPLFFVVAPILYFLPTIEAGLRQHRSLTSIGLVNLFLGWTLIGWVAAIAWACAGSNKPATTTASNSNVAPARAEPNVTPRTAAGASVADELQKLAELRDQKILTEEEFQMQKEKALNR